MAISLTCPHCHFQIMIPVHLRGRKINCSKCSVMLAVPLPLDDSLPHLPTIELDRRVIFHLLNQMRRKLGMYIGKPSVTRLASFHALNLLPHGSAHSADGFL